VANGSIEPKGFCTDLLGSATWSGSASSQVLPNIPLNKDPLSYRFLLIVLIVAATEQASMIFNPHFGTGTNTIYANMYIAEDSTTQGWVLIQGLNTTTPKVNSWVTTINPWYSSSKEIKIYGIR